LYDEGGLNRNELQRLAEKRLMAKHFDRSLLSPKGFFVDIADVDIKLPNGELVESGMQFRNLFHLHPLSSAELFVPCGGRPEAVNLANVDQLFFKKENGDIDKPRFRFIVEGANLFFSQEARLFLEKQGVILFKDASTNKGGVTSSSLEVLAALALDDVQFSDLMTLKHSHPTPKKIKEGEVDNVLIPEFYQSYVVEVQQRVEKNAADEFQCLWKTYQKEGTPLTLASDTLSIRINEMAISITESNLMDSNKDLCDKILKEAIPKVLLEKVGMEGIRKNVPESYLKAIFSSTLASQFIYRCGINPSPFAFYQFVSDFLSQS